MKTNWSVCPLDNTKCLLVPLISCGRVVLKYFGSLLLGCDVSRLKSAPPPSSPPPTAEAAWVLFTEERKHTGDS